MPFNFDDESKQVREYTESLPFGVTKVQFAGAVADVTKEDKTFIEVGVVAEDGTEDSARLWFVGGAANISFNTARQIAVHQGKDEEEKAKIRNQVDAIANTDDLVDLMNDVCKGGELWFTKYYDPERTYTAQDGSTRRSVNKNILGYEPKLKPQLMPQGSQEITKDNVAQQFPGAEPATGDAASNIPDSWVK